MCLGGGPVDGVHLPVSGRTRDAGAVCDVGHAHHIWWRHWHRVVRTAVLRLETKMTLLSNASIDTDTDTLLK